MMVFTIVTDAIRDSARPSSVTMSTLPAVEMLTPACGDDGAFHGAAA
ncbi:MAG: hypothetical protein U5R48_02510 [Gammaproteobacteria bacterium]|nr:hypothetical protein [Gammaproteobacteria bacterium]